jgi:preprotein translocase subunit SecY
VERSLKRRFALGIMPYISASIVVQLMELIPYLQNFKVMARVVEKD